MVVASKPAARRPSGIGSSSWPLADERDVEGHRPGHPHQRQIAGHRARWPVAGLDRRGDEGGLRELADRQEFLGELSCCSRRSRRARSDRRWRSPACAPGAPVVVDAGVEGVEAHRVERDAHVADPGDQPRRACGSERIVAARQVGDARPARPPISGSASASTAGARDRRRIMAALSTVDPSRARGCADRDGLSSAACSRVSRSRDHRPAAALGVRPSQNHCPPAPSPR